LRHLFRHPGPLQRMARIRRQPFDCRHTCPLDLVQRSLARPDGLSVDMHGAGPAQAPQRPAPQPNLVPVSFRWSRTAQSSGVSGSAVTDTRFPLMLKATMDSNLLACRRDLDSRLQVSDMRGVHVAHFCVNIVIHSTTQCNLSITSAIGRRHRTGRGSSAMGCEIGVGTDAGTSGFGGGLN
jgi:hypothetical protein